MTVVEDKLLNKSEYDELKNDPVERRQFTAEATAAPLHRDERQIHERNADNCLIDDHHYDGLSQLSTINLHIHHKTVHSDDSMTLMLAASDRSFSREVARALNALPLDT